MGLGMVLCVSWQPDLDVSRHLDLGLSRHLDLDLGLSKHLDLAIGCLHPGSAQAVLGPSILGTWTAWDLWKPKADILKTGRRLHGGLGAEQLS